jgi:hypothetical protein
MLELSPLCPKPTPPHFHSLLPQGFRLFPTYLVSEKVLWRVVEERKRKFQSPSARGSGAKLKVFQVPRRVAVERQRNFSNAHVASLRVRGLGKERESKSPVTRRSGAREREREREFQSPSVRCSGARVKFF